MKGLFDDAEQAGIASAERLKPTGQGPWGPVYGGLSGDPENAVAHLLRRGQGSVPGAASNAVAGPLDFVAGRPVRRGEGAFGLLHIDAQGRDDALRRLPDLARKGSPYSRLQETKSGLQPKGGRKGWYYLGDGEYEALLRGDFSFAPTDRPWTHTAYRLTPENKLPVGADQLSRATGFATPARTPVSTTGSASVLPTPPGVFGPDWQEAQRLLRAADEMVSMPAIAQKYRAMADGLLARLESRGVDTSSLRAAVGKATPIPAGAADAFDPTVSASFKAFDEALHPPSLLRDPRAYTGDLASALPPEAAQALAQGRALHRDMAQRFDTGPWSYAWRTGSDGLPMAQGAELGRRFVHGGASQAADIQALKRAVLERGPTMQAARDYALADLLEKSTNAKGQLSAEALRRNLNARSLMLGELLTPAQRQAIDAVADDAARAVTASQLAATRGSDTFQKTSNALAGGLLDSPFTQGALERIPLVGRYAAAGASGLAKGAAQKKAERLAGLLGDSGAAADALEGVTPGRVSGILDYVLSRQVSPSGVTLRQFLDLAPYLAAPVAATGAEGPAARGSR